MRAFFPRFRPNVTARTAAGAQAVESPKSSRCGVSLRVATLLPTSTVSTRSNTWLRDSIRDLTASCLSA
jgi:hypothetical protein